MKSVPSKKKKLIKAGNTKEKSFPIVAIGASLGGLKAILTLLKHLPSDTGMAYIYVQHLSPYHKSFLASILSKTTAMKVWEIEDMEQIKPDNVYVIPRNKGIEVVNGHIKLLPRSKASAALSIDTLFSSLAKTHKKNVIGIILSGSAHDGTKGLEAIKKAGGITFAQDDSAEAVSMPESAIAAGVVDFVMSPKDMAIELYNFSLSGFKDFKIEKAKDNVTDANDTGLKNIFSLLHKQTGVDFSHYKMSTVNRRIRHRMAQLKVETIKGYLKLLQAKSGEIDILHKDLLINVTSFFRDAESFRYLKSTLLPKLLKSKFPDKPLRIWVPACSTGEEAYSIGMLIIELQENISRKIPVQIFATDLSKTAISEARVGEYSESDMKQVSQKRAKRFFTKSGNTYRVKKELREMCVFAPHNILKDPPFFRMDFISCCNLLIYFDAAAQKKALSTLHFALREDGYLMLGKSESTAASASLFTQVTPKVKIYGRKKNTGPNKIPELAPRFTKTDTGKKAIIHHLPVIKTGAGSLELDKIIDAFLLKNHMPACAIINKDMEILQFRGSTSMYLIHPPGRATLNILKMARPDFSLELRSAITGAIKTKQTSRRSGIEMNSDIVGATFQKVAIEVSPLKIEWDEPLLIVVFKLEERSMEQSGKAKDGKNATSANKLLKENKKIKQLTDELNVVRQEMHSLIESQETALQELQVANEEIVSTNEEFQTLNEELETSKEEIEATNEELISTNNELQTRNDMLQESYNYSEMIINAIHEPILILDEKLHIRSASKSFYSKFNVKKEATEGKHFFELGNKQWDIPELHQLLREILDKNKDFDNFEVTNFFQGMGERIMLLNAHRIVQKSHKKQLIILAINDITERSRAYMKEKELLRKDILSHKEENIELEKAVKRRTMQLEQKNKELEKANKDLTSFTYISSHDLQEPLRKIQTFALQILELEEKNLSKTGKAYFLRLQEIAKRMQGLIEDLLKYSRVKSDEHAFEDTDLDALFSGVVKDMEEALQEKNAEVKIKNVGHANVVPFQFRQLLHNLISNSLKFSRKGVPPMITIKSETVAAEESANKKLSLGKKYLHLIYSDNGMGFDPQYKERIFEVFQRLNSFEEYKGTGIGLAICKRIVENHNGVITANGKINKGARFDIYIPVDNEK